VDDARAAAPDAEQATSVGEAAPRVEDVRAAVAGAGARTAQSQVVAREPRPRTAPAAEKRRRKWPVWAVVLAVSAALLVPVVAGLWIASQSVYFIGTDDGGRVTMFRGVPYELPAGLDLYSRNYVSGVPISEVPAARREALLDHKLRSHDDAVDLIRQLELGTLEP
jgi:protein phosphatase